MAKIAVINRDLKRRVTVKKFAAKRAQLMSIINDSKAGDEARYEARQALQQLPRNASPTRLRNRCAHRPLPPGELLGGAPTSNSKNGSESEMLNAFETADYFPHPAEDVHDKNVYNLEPDWATVFNDTSTPDWIKNRMPHRENEAPLIPSPWLDGQSTLWQKIGKNEKTQADLKGAEVAAETRLDDLQRKLDKMFHKLEQMEVTKSESNLLEILLFVVGGLFLFLILDILVKQGTQASMIIAAAGGGNLYKRYMPLRQLSR